MRLTQRVATGSAMCAGVNFWFARRVLGGVRVKGALVVALGAFR